MDDKQIIDLYWRRSENAIAETENKYGRYCRSIAYNILNSVSDSEECVNDAYLKVWSAIPPQRPEKLSVFLGRIVRNLALDRCKYNTREKRGSGQMPLVIDELAECVSDNTRNVIDDMVIVDCMNSFLDSLPEMTRIIFMRRYWYFSSIREIAKDYSISESNVKTTLLRARRKLQQFLEKEGVEL